MFRRLAPALFALLALAFAGAVLADARQDLHTAYSKLLAVNTYKMTLVEAGTGKRVMVAEFQAPDRYRMTTDDQVSSVVIGDTMYMMMDGKTMTMPMPKGMLSQYRSQEVLKEFERGTPVTAEGTDTVGGQACRKYRFTGTGKAIGANASSQYTSVVWVSIASGLPVQVETSRNRGGKLHTARMIYSDFNSPKIRISAPN